MSDQRHHINRLRKELEQYLNWGAVTEWHSSMFKELSERILSEQQIMLSIATLKRFFGVVNHDGKPSISTLDALCAFVGKKNWRAFKLEKASKSRAPIHFKKKSLYISLGFVLSLIFIVLIGNRKPELVINSTEFEFSSRPVSNEYPNSVVFDFEIPKEIRSDSFHIQQYWDDAKTILISKDQTQATGIYYFPGYFRAKLMVDGQIAKEHDLFLKSDGWIGTVEYEPVPKYFTPIQTSENSLSIPSEVAVELIASEAPLVSVFHFIDDLGNISGDNFSFSTTVQNRFDDKWAVCQTMNLYFIGTTGAMIIPFSKIGCSSDNNLMLNDNYLSGKGNDLSPLSADFSTSQNIKIEVSDRVVSISIGGLSVYTNTYEQSMGRLVGVRYKFLGIGEVESFRLEDLNNLEVTL